jgi:propane monooxygenase coupling protein
MTTPPESPFKSDSSPSNKCGFTLINNQVGEIVAQVMATKPNVTVTWLPSMMRVDAIGRMDVIYDEISEAAGEEPGWFSAAEFEESMSTHYGRITYEDDRAIMFANPEDAAEFLGFDLVAGGYSRATIPSGPSERATGGSGSDPWAKERVGGTSPSRDLPRRLIPGCFDGQWS